MGGRVGPQFRDPNTGFFLLSAMLERAARRLTEYNYLGVLLVDAAPLSRVERESGSEVYDALLRKVGAAIVETRNAVMREGDAIAVVAPHGEQFVIFLDDKRRAGRLKREDMESLADRVHSDLSARVFRAVRGAMSEVPRVSVGYSFAIGGTLERPMRAISRMVDEAREMSLQQSRRVGAKSREQLKDLLLAEKIATLYQPIVRMNGGSVFGYEALSRGPEGTPFEQPLLLFALAQEADLSFELDRVCRRCAIQNARGIGKDRNLFVNTLPSTIIDPQLRGKAFRRFLDDTGVDPRRLVIEITEHLALEDRNRLEDALRDLRQLGVRIAVDDVGTGHANLESILRLEPSFIKVDLSLVRGVHRSAMKREMLRALVAMSKEIDAETIAEGIEHPAEAETVANIGVDYGQGYLFARPAPAFPKVRRSAVTQLRTYATAVGIA